MAKTNFDLNIEHDPYVVKGNYSFSDSIKTDFWDVDETIPELAYLTHNFFRYYGKFPSKIGKLIVEKFRISGDIDNNKHIILDNYAGSGTSLVEGKLAGFDTVGIDINPLGVMASRVKTYCINTANFKKKFDLLCNNMSLLRSSFRKEFTLFDFNTPNNENPSYLEDTINTTKTQFPDINKWFSNNVIEDLCIIKLLIKNCQELGFDRREKEFLLCGFLAIIRRVSYAYDGEVRPHVNKTKKPRDVFDAFIKKINDMLDRMFEFNLVTNNNVISESFVCDNRRLMSCKNLSLFINERKKEIGLVISHPPYLNSFDYIPVFKLEFLWALDIPEIFNSLPYEAIKKAEIKSYPVQTHKHIEAYFENNRTVYEEIYNLIKPGALCCIVIGDCTVKGGILLRTHKIIAKICEEIGFKLEEVIYRSTHYGLGKYAYSFRADYHGEEDTKKDGILILRK